MFPFFIYSMTKTICEKNGRHEVDARDHQGVPVAVVVDCFNMRLDNYFWKALDSMPRNEKKPEKESPATSTEEEVELRSLL